MADTVPLLIRRGRAERQERSAQREAPRTTGDARGRECSERLGSCGSLKLRAKVAEMSWLEDLASSARQWPGPRIVRTNWPGPISLRRVPPQDTLGEKAHRGARGRAQRRHARAHRSRLQGAGAAFGACARARREVTRAAETSAGVPQWTSLRRPRAGPSPSSSPSCPASPRAGWLCFAAARPRSCATRPSPAAARASAPRRGRPL